MKALYVTFTHTVRVPITDEDAATYTHAEKTTNDAIKANDNDPASVSNETLDYMVDGFDEYLKVLARCVPASASIQNSRVEDEPDDA